MPPNITIVLIAFNSAHILRSALAPIQEQQVIVFDNASSDETRSICKNEFPGTRLVCSDANLGYGRAANEAFKLIDTNYALLLNPDVEIESDALNDLIAMAENAEGDWLYIAPNTGHVVTEIDSEPHNSLQRITHATGCALLFNLDNFRKLGGFDPNIFLYYEEMDLSIRAKKARLDMYYAENISFPHNSKKSVAASETLDRTRNWHFQWSSLYYKKKHRLWWPFLEGVVVNLFISPFKQIFASPDRAARYKTKRRATLDFLKGRPAFVNSKRPYIPG